MNCLLKHIIEGKIEERREVTEIRGRRCKQLLNVKGYETRGYWKLKEEALDLTLRRTCFGRGYGPVVRMRRVYKSFATRTFYSSRFRISPAFRGDGIELVNFS